MTTGSKRTAALAMPAFAIMLAAVPASAQHDGHQTPAPTATAVSPELMNACVTAQREGAALADRANARLEAARQTNSAADMRAALDDLQAALGQIRMKLQVCDPVAAAAAAPAKADPHAGHQVGTVPPATAAPGAPVMQPGRTTPAPAAPATVDHSKMGHGTPAKPAAKPKAAEVDHSKMGHGTPATKPAAAPKSAAGGSPKLPVTPAERVMDPACPNIDTKTAPTATYQKKVYYFCSTRDRDEFVKDPVAYLKKRPR